MRASTISTGLFALSLCLTALPALAQDDGYGYRFHEDGDSGLSGYAGLRGSLAFMGEAKGTIPGTTPTSMRASYDIGGGASFYVGTRLPLGLRLEGEALYRYLPFTDVTLAGTGAAAHGCTQMGGPMVNLLWDLPVPSFPFRPFIGGGIGGLYTASKLNDATNANTYYRNHNWAFAYQLLAGAELPLSQSSRFTAMYRWLNVNDVNGRCGLTGLTPATACKADINSQSVDLGIELDM